MQIHHLKEEQKARPVINRDTRRDICERRNNQEVIKDVHLHIWSRCNLPSTDDMHHKKENNLAVAVGIDLLDSKRLVGCTIASLDTAAVYQTADVDDAESPDQQSMTYYHYRSHSQMQRMGSDSPLVKKEQED